MPGREEVLVGSLHWSLVEPRGLETGGWALVLVARQVLLLEVLLLEAVVAPGSVWTELGN